MQPYIILYKTTLHMGVRNLPKVFYTAATWLTDLKTYCSVVVPRGAIFTARPRTVVFWPRPRSRVMCLGLASVSRHYSTVLNNAPYNYKDKTVKSARNLH